MAPPKTPKPIPRSVFEEGGFKIETPEHNWEHRGINPPLTENGTRYFSGVLLRYLVSFMFGIISAAFFFGGKSRDVSDLQTWRGTVDAILIRMDKEGTNSSRLRVEQESQLIKSNSDQIADLYRKIEPMGAMQAKIERLQHDIDAKK